MSHGSIYAALYKLDHRGLITAEWRSTENNRRAKFYSLTRVGRRYLQSETVDLVRLSSAITAVPRLRDA